MLRSTTESMAAVIGGCRFRASPLSTTHSANRLGILERIAGNSQIILREEAALDKVADPASGSYILKT